MTERLTKVESEAKHVDQVIISDSQRFIHQVCIASWLLVSQVRVTKRALVSVQTGVIALQKDHFFSKQSDFEAVKST